MRNKAILSGHELLLLCMVMSTYPCVSFPHLNGWEKPDELGADFICCSSVYRVLVILARDLQVTCVKFLSPVIK